MDIIVFNNNLADADINISKNLVEKAGKKIKDRNDVDMSLDEAFNIMSECRSRHDIALICIYNQIKNIASKLIIIHTLALD